MNEDQLTRWFDGWKFRPPATGVYQTCSEDDFHAGYFSGWRGYDAEKGSWTNFASQKEEAADWLASGQLCNHRPPFFRGLKVPA